MNPHPPPRGPALDGLPLLLSFDIDCGELIPGHRFIARGLAGRSALPIPDARGGDATDGYPAFSLEYELVPGIEPLGEEGNFFRYLVGISYTADVELPWEPTDGGAVAPFTGGPQTHGSRGDWPLPPDATVLTFTLCAVGADGFVNHEEPAGELVVDLSRGQAVFTRSTNSRA